MQALIAVPNVSTRALTEAVAGVPLLVRVIATAVRAGANELLLFWPRDLGLDIWQRLAASPALRGLKSVKIEALPFDPRESTSWAAIRTLLGDEFLWMPWNFVTSTRILVSVERAPVLPFNWDKPVRLTKEVLEQGPPAEVTFSPDVEGVSINSPEDVSRAERFLVTKSGKPTDGVYSKFNRKLSRPFVRALTHTHITPNMVTLVGLGVAVISALVYSRGFYLACVAGAILFFISGLIDEMDGMLARITFRESAFGTWFEGFVDNATYLLLFAGITAGLYRQYGKGELIWGITLIVGCLLSICVVATQRKLLTAPNRSHEYSTRMNQLMEADSSLISRVARQIHIFIKKGVAVHYVLIFTIAGGLPIFLRLASIAANLTWTIASYVLWRFTRNNRPAPVTGLRSAI